MVQYGSSLNDWTLAMRHKKEKYKRSSTQNIFFILNWEQHIVEIITKRTFDTYKAISGCNWEGDEKTFKNCIVQFSNQDK